jgi:hypothetical protein
MAHRRGRRGHDSCCATWFASYRRTSCKAPANTMPSNGNRLCRRSTRVLMRARSGLAVQHAISGLCSTFCADSTCALLTTAAPSSLRTRCRSSALTAFPLSASADISAWCYRYWKGSQRAHSSGDPLQAPCHLSSKHRATRPPSSLTARPAALLLAAWQAVCCLARPGPAAAARTAQCCRPNRPRRP